MYPRLKLLQRLLADDGVIFISIDDRAQVLLRMICNEYLVNIIFSTVCMAKAHFS